MRRTGTRPSHPLADFAGEYEHPGYGVLKIETLPGDRLQATFNRIRGLAPRLAPGDDHRQPAAPTS